MSSKIAWTVQQHEHYNRHEQYNRHAQYNIHEHYNSMNSTITW
jgi:hypothetical protein